LHRPGEKKSFFKIFCIVLQENKSPLCLLPSILGGQHLAQINLITGGSRSGKSNYAQTMAEALSGPRTYIATCLPLDDEMKARIAKHQAQRQTSQWLTIEEPLALTDALRKTRQSRVCLVDCLTLWVNNLLYETETRGQTITESDLALHCRDVLKACSELDGTVILVTNEVGMGIVPDHPQTRHFRDLAGRCNQIMAAGADRVVLVVSGLPLCIKGSLPYPDAAKT
jgi:adenosylcobinamide kinase / adenosylcobinamide-phosphate guanylyltransferase